MIQDPLYLNFKYSVCTIIRWQMPISKWSGPLTSFYSYHLRLAHHYSIFTLVTTNMVAIKVLNACYFNCPKPLLLIKTLLSQIVVSIIPQIYYYLPCFFFSGNVPCRSTWQSKYNDTFKSQTLSFQVPSYKKLESELFLSESHWEFYTSIYTMESYIWPQINLE